VAPEHMKISFSSSGPREAVGSCSFASAKRMERDGNEVPDISRPGQPYKTSSSKVYRRPTHSSSLGDMCVQLPRRAGPQGGEEPYSNDSEEKVPTLDSRRDTQKITALSTHKTTIVVYLVHRLGSWNDLTHMQNLTSDCIGSPFPHDVCSTLVSRVVEVVLLDVREVRANGCQVSII